jgi:hypothetical protein
LTGNSFKFTPINSSNLAVIPVCFEVSGSPANVVDIVVENNSLDPDFISDDETNQLLKFNAPLSIVSGANKRFSIHGNLTGNISDREWYLTVGDGENSLGDVNGTKALNYLSNIYSNLFNATLPTGVNYNDQLTIYIRPGFYIIDSGFNSDGLGTKLIGLIENGNIPRIQITNPTDAAPGGITLDSNATNVLLGTHLENLNIQHRTSAYIRLVSFVGLNNPSSYESYSERYTVKNCTFLNCGLYPRTVTSMGSNREKQAQLLIEGCRFYTFTGSLYEKQHSIVLDQSKADILIKNCVWEASDGSYDFRGYLVTNAASWNTDTDESNVTIENCNAVISAASGNNYLGLAAAPIQLNNVENLNIINSYIDISATTADFDYIVYTLNSSLTGPESVVNIFDNKFVGTDGGQYTSATFPQIGIYVNHNYSETNIVRNIFESNPFGIWCNFANTTGTKNPHTLKATENIYKSGVTGDIFIYCSSGTTDSGNHLIKDNTLDYNDQVAGSVLDGTTSFVGIAGAIKVFITSATNEDTVHITGNNIQDYKASGNISESQSAIMVNAAKTVNISDNTIDFSDILANTTHAIALTIYLLVGFSYINTTIDYSSAKISKNYIKATSLNINSTCIPIYARNYNYVNITENTIIANTRVTNYVMAYSSPNYTNLMDGVIRDNIFGDSLLFKINVNGLTGAVISEQFVEEIILHDITTTFDTRIAAYNNKNQKVIIDANCTDFKTYGYEEMDGYRGPMIMMSNSDMLLDARSNNKNKSKGQQILGGIFTTTGSGNEVLTTEWALPHGLYLTNAWRTAGRNSDDPMMESGGLPPLNHYKNQIIIPIDLPYGTEIVGIDIPIHYYNTNIDGYDVTVTASASLVFGNIIDDGTITGGDGYVYIPDGSFDPPFALNTTVVGNDSSSSIRLTNDILTAGNNKYKNEAWLNRAASAPDSYGVPRPNAYILLAMDREVDTDVTEYERSLLYAIPYARVIVRY